VTFRKYPWLGPLVALVLTYALFAVLTPETFTRSLTLVTMARQTVVVGIAAAGMTLIIVMGGIDLSVGSAVAFTSVVTASLLRADFGPVAACALSVLAVTAVGALVGGIITKLRVTPFIVTLGAMSILRGAAKGLAGGQKIDADAQGLDTLAYLPKDQRWMVLPPSVWLLLGISLCTAGLLRYTRFGRHVLAVGSNEQAARVCGIAVDRVKVSVYAIGAALAGVAGIVQFSTLTVGDPTGAIGLELDVIAAVVVGGGSLSGGQGSVLGSLLGAFLMTVIKTGCTHLGYPNWVQEIITGIIIVLAVVVDRLRARAAA